MQYINLFGLTFMLVLMIPNIIFAAKCREGFVNLWLNRPVEVLEQIGRLGCFAFMVGIVPGCGFGFPSKGAFVGYLLLDGVLVAVYCLVWLIGFRKNGVGRALALSGIPAAIFLISGLLSCYWPLILSAVIFAPCHILISYKNAVLRE